MSNYHLKDMNLTLKAKGLLSQMLSLPDTWDFTLRGLAHINKESIDAIRTAVKELEQHGYITRQQGRDAAGKLTNIEYTIYEHPQQPSPRLDNPITAPPCLGFPYTVKPTSDNPTQLNTYVSSKKEVITDLSSTHSIPFTSPREREAGTEKNGTETASINDFDIYREIIHDNIEYPYLLDNNKCDHDRINEIVDLMLETVCTARKTIRIASDEYPAEFVKDRFLKLDSLHIEFVLDCLKKNTTEIRSIKKYLLAVLFNAPSTIGNYYTGLVNHDIASGKLSGGDDKC